MESYAEWRSRLIASDLPHPCKVVVNTLWKVTEAGGLGGNKTWAQDLQAATKMKPEVILKHLNYAFKKRWVGAKRYIYGVPIDNVYDFYVITSLVVVPEKKPTKPKNLKGGGLIQLPEWEEKHGVLNLLMVQTWANGHRLDLKHVSQLIEEFRMEMLSKEKKYADFRLTFMTWLTKGYLSKKMDQIKITGSAVNSSVRHSTPGHSI